MTTITLKVPPGIGDFLWTWMKLASLPEDVRIRILMPADDSLRRGEPAVHLLGPRVEFAGYRNDFSTEDTVRRTVFPGMESTRLIEEASKPSGAFFALNHWLESGRRIGAALPDVETDFHPPIAGTPAQAAEAAGMLAGFDLPIALYTSAYGPARAWGFWDPRKWCEFIERVENVLPVRPVWALIGAKYDLEYSVDISRSIRARGGVVVDQVGTGLGIAVELIRRCRYLFGFPSGIPILSGLLGVPTLMFFPPHLDAMRETFVHPADAAGGFIIHVPFMEPREAQQRFLEHGMPHALKERS